MQPTFTPTILPSQKKADGTYNIKIHVTYKRRTKRLSTNLNATPKDLTKGLKLKECPIKRKAYELADQMREYCEEIDYFELQSMEVEDVVKFLEAKAESKAVFQLDFVKYMREKALTKGPSSRIYTTAANALARYMDGRVLNVNDINVKFLRSYEEYLRNEPRMCSDFGRGKVKKTKKVKGDCRAINHYIGRLRNIYALARMEFNEPDLGIYRIPNNPFDYYSVPKPPAPKRRNKSQEFIQMIINESAKAKGAKKFALEVFLLCFALEGMNLADMYSCRPSTGGWLIYNRRKTSGRRDDKAEHHVYISEKIRPLVERMMDSDGVHMFSFHRRYKSFSTFTSNANVALGKWREEKGVEHFSMYSARHSFASIGRRVGIEKATIDEMLCHVGSLRMADVYIEPDWEIHRRANERLLGMFDWSPIQ